MRTYPPTAAGRFFIPVPTPPTRLLAPQRSPTSLSGKMNRLLRRIEMLEHMHRERLAPFRSDPRFINVRQRGTIAALDLDVFDIGLSLARRAAAQSFLSG